MPRRRSSQRLEKAQEAAFTALAAVSSYLDSDEDLPVFFGRLSETVAGLVRARRAGFWQLGPQGVLSFQPPAFRFAPDSPLPAPRIPPGPRPAPPPDRTAPSAPLAAARLPSPP